MGILIYFIIPMVLGFAAQFWVRKSVERAQAIPTNLTGEAAARLFLTQHGVDCNLEPSPDGPLSDHYDPRARVIRLSDQIYGVNSVAAVTIAAHEVGHALQHHTAHTMFRIRGKLAPTAMVASQIWLVPMLIGVFAGSLGLIWIAAAIFATVLLFHLITLPVEIDASRRAMRLLRESGVVDAASIPAARNTLVAASSTYLVAALSSLMLLLYILSARR